jgi:hypothetical protein
MSGNNASSQIKALDFKLTAGTPVWTITTAAVGTDAGINIMPNGSAGLSLATSGAATFSSSVQATSALFTSRVRVNGASDDADIAFQVKAPSGTGKYIMFGRDSAEIAKFTLSAEGAAGFASSVTATSFFESSDSRLKTLIQDNYQTKGIASITPKLYTKNGKVELGYYAQDFVGVLDSAISKGSDDMLSLSYREVLVAKVYALEQEIKELKAKMN